MEKDPVCGMTVDPARAKATHEHAGKMYYFCCAGCKENSAPTPQNIWRRRPLSELLRCPRIQCRLRPPAAARAASQPVAESAAIAAAAARKPASERIHLPDGSRSPPARTGRLPEVRDGAGTCGRRASCDQDRIHLPHASGNRAGRAGILPDLRNGAGAENSQRRGGEKSRTCEYDPADSGSAVALTIPILVVAMADIVPGAFGADAVRFAKSLAMVRIHPRDSGCVVGRLAVLCARRGDRSSPAI